LPIFFYFGVKKKMLTKTEKSGIIIYVLKKKAINKETLVYHTISYEVWEDL